VQNEEEDDEGLGAAAGLITNLVTLFFFFFCFFFFFFFWSSGGWSLSFQFAQQLLLGRELPVKKLRLFLFFFSMKGEGMAKFVDVSRGLLFLGLPGVGSGCKLEGL
jgi:hypothetical protein